MVEFARTGNRGSGSGVGGVLCNDPVGLCLACEGKMSTNNQTGEKKNDNTGVYTSLARLASQLSPAQEMVGGMSSNPSPHHDAATVAAPLVTVEMDSSCVLLKDYNAHVIAFLLPPTSNTTE